MRRVWRSLSPLPAESVAVLGALSFLVASLTPAEALIPDHADVALYFDYARRLLAGELPYRDIPLEYPPVSLVAFLTPYVASVDVPRTLDGYRWAFAAQSAILSITGAAVVSWCAARVGGEGAPRRSIAVYTVLAAVLAPVLTWRFDLLPSVLAISAVALALAGRPLGAGTAIGVGFMAKVFPAVLLPVLALYFFAAGSWRAMVRLMAGFVVAVAMVAAPLVLTVPGDLFDFVSRQQQRPIQIESMQGGLHLLAHVLFGTDVAIVRDFGSINIVSPGSTRAVDIQPIVVLTALGGTFLVYILRTAEDVRRYGNPLPATLIAAATAVLLALVVTNKVFSPQYVIWLLPLAALLPRWQALVMVVVGFLTTVIFPLNYRALVEELDPVMIVILNVRNALLLGLLVALLVPPRQAARGRSAAGRSRPEAAIR